MSIRDLNKSDEDFLNDFSTEEKKPSENENQEENTNTNLEKTSDDVPVEGTTSEEINKEDSSDVEEETEKEVEDSQKEKEEGKETTSAPEPETISVDYESAYKKVFAPFKADGKLITAKTPEEVISLMQKGANYTRNMQQLAPYKKLMLMLENNGLLDEEKLSRLIDIEKKNPNAIKRLVKESGIDPLELDGEIDPNIPDGNHIVSNEAVAFKTVLEDLRSSNEGMETLQEINTKWDEQSKGILYQNPEIMETIHAQKQNGIYGKIVEELDRLKSIGKITANIPFIHAYKHVGDMLHQQGKFAPEKKPIARKVASKPKLDNSRVISAGSDKPVTKTKNAPIDYFNMSDEDIMKA